MGVEAVRDEVDMCGGGIDIGDDVWVLRGGLILSAMQSTAPVRHADDIVEMSLQSHIRREGRHTAPEPACSRPYGSSAPISFVCCSNRVTVLTICASRWSSFRPCVPIVLKTSSASFSLCSL